MAFGQNQHADSGFYHYQDAEGIDDELNRVSFPIKQISAVANADYEVQLGDAVARPLADTSAEPPRGAITGSMVGAICGCLGGLGVLAVPGIGLVAVVGTTGTTLIMTLAGTGIGVACGGLIDALSGVEPAADEVKR